MLKEGILKRYGVLKKLTEHETVILSENERNNMINQIERNKINRKKRINSMSSPSMFAYKLKPLETVNKVDLRNAYDSCE